MKTFKEFTESHDPYVKHAADVTHPKHIVVSGGHTRYHAMTKHGGRELTTHRVFAVGSDVKHEHAHVGQDVSPEHLDKLEKKGYFIKVVSPATKS